MIRSLAFTIDGNGFAPPGSQFSAAFEVDDVARLHAALREGGIEVSDVHDPVCRAAFVTDPDGNKFAIHERDRAT